MVVNVGQAKTDLSKLLRQVEAGEEVVIARDGVAVARLIAIGPQRVGERLLAEWGSHAGQGWIGDDFEFDEAELEEIDGSDDDPT